MNDEERKKHLNKNKFKGVWGVGGVLRRKRIPSCSGVYWWQTRWQTSSPNLFLMSPDPSLHQPLPPPSPHKKNEVTDVFPDVAVVLVSEIVFN